MSEQLTRSVITLPCGKDLPHQGDLEPNELGYVYGPGGNILVIGGPEKQAIPVWSSYAYNATKITNEEGVGMNLGGDTKPIYLKNGIFMQCAGDKISGTADSALSWASPTSIRVNLASTTAGSLIGGETSEVQLGITGTLPIACGGTGATTATGAASAIISGQDITPRSITTRSSHYGTSVTGALNMNNSSIIKAHGLWFNSAATTVSTGIFFPRSNDSNFDRLYAVNGLLYFHPNCPDGGTATERKVFFDTGDGGTINSAVRIHRQGGDVDRTAADNKPSLVVDDGWYQLMFDGNEIMCSSLNAPGTGQALWLNGELAIPPNSWGTAAPTDSTIGTDASNGMIYFQVVS